MSLSEDGSLALVGAYGDDTPGGGNAGSARVFVRSGTSWTEEATLFASDGAAGDNLGWSVSLSGDGSRALLGAPGDATAGGVVAGSARVFVRSGTSWTEEATLRASDGAASDALGESVSLNGDASRALVGARADDTAGGANAGSARVFLRSGTSWTEEATLLASDGAGGDNLGMSLSLSGDGSRALVGAPRDNTAGGVSAGSVRVFVRSGTSWTEEATLLASDGVAADLLGYSVSLSGDRSRALVGAFLDDTAGGTNAGSARVFPLTWVPLPPNGASCATPAGCDSGFCVEGICCDAACGGDVTDDCQACAAASTGLADGTCGPVLAAAALTCRPAAGVCDLPEVCDGASTACPANGVVGAGIECRAAADACDVAEACNGAGVICPADGFAASGTECRAAADACDVAEACDGAGVACPTDGFAASGTECRAAAGACDVAEACDGAAAACPTDGVAADGSGCDDGVMCNGSEACLAGACEAGTGLDCDDGDVCTADSCAEPDGCAHEPVAGCCVDDTGCDDGDECSADTCDLVTSTCAHEDIAGCGLPDGGPADAGSGDAGSGDAGSGDAGSGDAGSDDAGSDDAGSDGGSGGGCACRATGERGGTPSGWLFGLLGVFVWSRRRRPPRSLSARTEGRE